MGSLSIWHWIIVLAVGLLLFGGRGKISELMGDFAKGIKSFKKGMAEEETGRRRTAKTDPQDDRPSARPRQPSDRRPSTPQDRAARWRAEPRKVA